MSSRLDAEAKALIVAFHTIGNNNVTIRHIFLSYSDLLVAINTENYQNAWRSDPWINIFRNLPVSISDPKIHMIPRSQMAVALKLATHGSNLHTITLFHQSRDLPR